MKLQYKSLHNLKEDLPQGQAIDQMNFVENFTCTSDKEVRNEYWNSSAATLHPVITYYSALDGTLTLVTYIFVSHDLAHNFGTVFTILRQLMPNMKMKIPLRKLSLLD